MKKLKSIILLVLVGLGLGACGTANEYEERLEVKDGVPVYIKISDGRVGYETAYEEFNATAKEQILNLIEEGNTENGLVATFVMPTNADINQHQIAVYYDADTLGRVDWEAVEDVVRLGDARYGTAAFVDEHELFRTKSAADNEDVPDVYFNYTGAEYKSEG